MGPVWIPPAATPALREAEFHVLLWQVHGTTDLMLSGEKCELNAGHAVWVPVETEHEFTVRANSVTAPLFFEASETATILQHPTFFPVEADLQTLMMAYMVSWHTMIKPKANLSRQILSIIEASPVVSAALPMPTSEPAKLIAEALLFNPGDIRSVDELAESVYTSARTVERAFADETGTTLRQWRIANRMETAAALLRSNSTVDAVAHRVGYTNVNSLRRVFTAHFGSSPTKYARRYRT